MNQDQKETITHRNKKRPEMIQLRKLSQKNFDIIFYLITIFILLFALLNQKNYKYDNFIWGQSKSF